MNAQERKKYNSQGGKMEEAQQLIDEVEYGEQEQADLNLTKLLTKENGNRN